MNGPAYPERCGETWTKEEEDKLKEGFLRGETIESLAQQHGRTMNAICTKLERNGLLVYLIYKRAWFRVGEQVCSFKEIQRERINAGRHP